jgi:transposase
LLDVARIYVSPDPDHPQWGTPPAGLQRLATTVETWWPEILAFLHTGITNAGSEGTNRVIKTVARDAYGFRNPVNQRLRTRCATTRRARGHLDAR